MLESLFSKDAAIRPATLLKRDYNKRLQYKLRKFQLFHRGAVVITTAQLHSTKPELRFCAGSNPASGVSEIRDGEDL